MDELKANGGLVDSLGSAVRHGGESLKTLPALVQRVLETGAWKEFRSARDEVVTWERFEDFVEARPTKGIGSSVDQIKKLCSGTPAEDALREELKSQGNHLPKTDEHNYDNITDMLTKTPAQTGTSRAYTKTRLPEDLKSKVTNGALSANAAAIQAGIRKRKVQVVPEDPEQVARILLKWMTPDDTERLIELLKENTDD